VRQGPARSGRPLTHVCALRIRILTWARATEGTAAAQPTVLTVGRGRSMSQIQAQATDPRQSGASFVSWACICDVRRRSAGRSRLPARHPAPT